MWIANFYKPMRNLIILVLFALTQKLVSQNLVTNPSFENYSNCPTSSGQFNALNWQVTANCGQSSPDYYNVCSPGTQGVPSNVVGNQNAYNGNAYAGIYCYYAFLPLREYMQSQLSSLLVAGQTYYVSFRASLGDDYGIAIGSLGAYISNNPITGNGTYGPIAVVPQIISSSIISSTANWIQITGSFVANGGEQYITIGNFATDTATPHTTNSNAFISDMAYYYIDMVEVTTTPLITTQFYNTDVTVFPNPLKDHLTVEYQNQSADDILEVYTLDGKQLKKMSVGNSTIDLHDLPSGVYFIYITKQDSDRLVKKIVKL
jgi:OOP family OmpA-OmpF porin